VRKRFGPAAYISLAILSVFLGWPTWQASGLAASRGPYLIWSAGQSIVATTLIVGVLALVWGRFRQVSTAFFVCGLIALAFGLSLRVSAPVMFEQSAPGLTSAGSGTWVSTTIREQVSTSRGLVISQSALAARVQQQDGTVVEALTSNRYDRTGSTVELLRDRDGVLWVGGEAGDFAILSGSITALFGLIAMAIGLSAKISSVRVYVRRMFESWLSK
jgi:hypothetical protein